PEIVGAECRLQFRQRAERQAKAALLTVQDSGRLAAPSVGRHGAAAKLTGPADSSAISNVTSPSWAPVYSGDVIWNGPPTVPRPGTVNCHAAISPPKNLPRIAVSDWASLKMPEPLIAARWTPLPASSSRQRPADSASVMSTAALLNASRFDRSPATVT